MRGSWRVVAQRSRGWAGRLADLVLPQTCVCCGDWISGGGGWVCASCDRALRRIALADHCPRCLRTVQPWTVYDGVCRFCRPERHWNVAGAARVGPYVWPLTGPLLALKFAGQERAAALLGKLLAEAIRGQVWCERIEALVPVPMHWRRRLQRPCDHARRLAEHVARELHLPVWRVVTRVRYTTSQMHLSTVRQRRANVRGCFLPLRRPDVRGRTVCIVDNLVLTGATVCEVSRALRRAGASRVYAAVVARAHLPGEPPAYVDLSDG